MFTSDTISPATVDLINDAIITAAVTGSRGGGAIRDQRFLDGSRVESFVKIDRVVACNSAAWRITDASDASVIGVVVPWGSGRKSRHASHAQNDYVALAEA